MATAHDSEVCQPIPVIKIDLVGPLLTMLDAHFALYRVMEYANPISILPSAREYGDVRHAVLLWATAHNLSRHDHQHHDDRVGLVRTVRIYDGAHEILTMHVPDECDVDPKPTAPAYAPEPRLIIDADSMWSPAQAVRL